MDFKKFQAKITEEVRLTYKDVLRLIFSKKFVRMRFLWTVIAVSPPLFYMIITEDKTFTSKKREFDYLTQVEIPRELDELVPRTTAQWKHGLSYSMSHFPR